MNTLANDTQVGGNHYKSRIQHWDFVANRAMGYFEGQVTKYVTRWRKKNGRQDLEKARHFLVKMIELERAKSLPWTFPRQVLCLPKIARVLTELTRWHGLLERQPDLGRISVDSYARDNGLTAQETKVVALVVEWEGDVHLLESALKVLDDMLADEAAARAGAVDSGEPGPGYVNQDR